MSEAALAAEPRAPRRLPPRPRARTWIVAGLCAGLLLGEAEVAALQLGQAALPPRLAVVLIFGSGLLVALLAGTAGAMLAVRGARATHSAMVGALLGPLLLAPALTNGVALAAGLVEHPGSAALRLVTMLLLAVAASAFGARAGERMEEAGTPLSGPIVWAGAAGLVALGEEAVARSLGARWLFALSGAVLVMVGLVTAAQAALARRGSPPWSWRALTTLLGALGVAVAFAPRALPWLLLGPDLPALAKGPPHVVLLRLGSAGDAGAAGGPGTAAGYRPNASLLATEAIAYERVEGAGAWALLEAGGAAPASVLAWLTAHGYATAALLRDPAAPAPPGAGEVDARPGAAGLLEGPGSRTAAGGLLLAAGPAAARALGLGAQQRSADELTTDALTWLLRWRTTRSGVPFFLAIDYAPDLAAEEDAERLDAQLGRLLARLADLELDRDTCVLVERAGQAAPADTGARRAELLFRPPPRAESMPRGVRVREPVAAAEIARALLLLPQVEGGSALPLPGIEAGGAGEPWLRGGGEAGGAGGGAPGARP